MTIRIVVKLSQKSRDWHVTEAVDGLIDEHKSEIGEVYEVEGIKR